MPTNRLGALGRGALAVSLAALPAGHAAGVEWSLTGVAGQRVEAISNPDVEPDSDGAAYGSITTLSLTLGARTERTVWSLSSGVALSAFGGPGADDDLTRPNPSVRGSVVHTGQRFDIGGDFAISRQSTTFLEFDTAALLEAIERGEFLDDGTLLIDDDLLRESATVRTSYAVGANANYALTQRSRLSLSANGRITRFSDETDRFVPSSSYGTRLALDHALSEASGVGFTLAARSFTADDPEETEGYTLSAGLTMRTALSQATRMNAGLGLGYTSVDEFTLNEEPQRRTTDTDLSVNANLGATYSATEDTLLSFRASHGVVPSSFGDLRNVTSIAATLNQSLTPLTSLSVIAQHSIQTELGSSVGGDDLTQAFFFSPVLSYRFAPEWTASVGYSLRLIDDDDGTGVSNRVFLGVSRSLRFFP